MSQWLDTESKKHVWVIAAERVEDWPSRRPWRSKGFALLFVAERVFDVGPLAKRALKQGLAFVCVWGPGCVIAEETFDEAIVGDGTHKETEDDVVLTTSHADESLEEALEFFLDVMSPSKALVAKCEAHVVFALGAGLGERIERALEHRYAVKE